MHEERLSQWQRSHSYLGAAHDRNAGRTRLVMWLTLAMMVAEIAAGTMFRSMALLADGWHMASHAAALGIASAAYFYARRNVANESYSFGTGKVFQPRVLEYRKSVLSLPQTVAIQTR